MVVSMTRRVLLCAALGAVSLAGFGCTNTMWAYPHAGNETLGMSAEDHYHHVKRISDIDRRALQDDWDVFWMTDRPTRLTRWH